MILPVIQAIKLCQITQLRLTIQLQIRFGNNWFEVLFSENRKAINNTQISILTRNTPNHRKGTLIDAVAIAAFELGIFESAGVAHKKLMEGIKGIPAKAVEAVLNKLLSLGHEAASNGPTSPYGPELTAYEGFPIVGSMEFAMDFLSAPAMKAIPHFTFRCALTSGYVSGAIS